MSIRPSFSLRSSVIEKGTIKHQPAMVVFQDAEIVVDYRKWRLSMNKKIVADLCTQDGGDIQSAMIDIIQNRKIKTSA